MAKEKPILVIGLGRFGGAVAETLVELDREVLAVEADARLVQEYADRLTHVVEADATSEAALRQLGAEDFEQAVVAIGTNLEASILCTSILSDFGIKKITAKAITSSHGRILERVGATRVVYPEREMGERIAHVVTGQMLNYIEFEDGFALVETSPPAGDVGKTLGEAQIRDRFGVTVVCIKRAGEDFTYATTDTRIESGDLLIVAGRTDLAEAFAAAC